MCFYYSINRSNVDILAKKGILSKRELDKIPNKSVVNGFERPKMPVVSTANPHNISFYQWGLIPNTITTPDEAKRFVGSYNTLNAKIESAIDSKIYSDPILGKRCLVLSSGFYEWRHVKGMKIPYYISLKDQEIFAFAGIWDSWKDSADNIFFTFSILTTKANELMAKIHNTKKRMPVILEIDKAEQWLSEKLNEDDLKQYHQPIDQKRLNAYTIKQFLPLKQPADTIPGILDPFPYPDLEKDDQNKSGDQLTLEW